EEDVAGSKIYATSENSHKNINTTGKKKFMHTSVYAYGKNIEEKECTNRKGPTSIGSLLVVNIRALIFLFFFRARLNITITTCLVFFFSKSMQLNPLFKHEVVPIFIIISL
ncbi:hypothetical protein ACJX0J_011974, partial [Zea mays]